MKPVSFDEALKMSRDAAILRVYMRARLVELTTVDNAVAIRAIELLMSMPDEQSRIDLSAVSIDDLREARGRAEQWLQRITDQI